MSALWAGWAPLVPARRIWLRPVDAPTQRLARFPFLLVLIGIFGLGMAGLLMLNTTLQNQAFQARSLNRQATHLAYVQADLENRAGMRPNPHPAFLVLPEGRIIGEATAVSGREMPSLVVKTTEEVAAERAKAAAAAKKAAAERAAAEQQAAAKRAKRPNAVGADEG